MALDRPFPISLAVQPSNRGVGASATAKDAKIVNAYLDQDPATGEWWAVKRPALVKIGPTASGGQGIGSWQTVAYVVANNTLYQYASAFNTFTSIGSMTNLNSKLTRILSWNAPTKGWLVAWSADAAYLYQSSISQISGANFPSSGVKGMAFLDGTLYVLDTFGNIAGSAINDPTDWTDTTNVVTNWTTEDNPTGLARFGNYIVSFMTHTMDVYYDAGNPTGSPLSIIQSAHQAVGLSYVSTLQQIGDELFWLGSGVRGEIGVYSLGIDLSLKKISTPPIERLLSRVVSYTLASVSSANALVGYSAMFAGHVCYVLGMTGLTGAYSGPASAAITVLYDTVTNKWYQWTWWDGTPFAFVGSTSELYKHSDGSYSQESLFLHPQDGEVYILNEDTYTDDEGQFAVDIVTPNIDAGTRFIKGSGALDLVGSQQEGSLAYLRWSDDDYQTWMEFLPMDLAMDLASLPGIGSFRKRAFHVHHSGNYPFRVKRLDLYTELGTR